MMDMRIFKYEIGFNTTLKLPAGSTILKVAQPEDRPYMWAMVDIHAEREEERNIHIYGTGHTLPSNIVHAKFIDTFFDGPYVWHAFEFTGVEW
ncbi:MAG: hypothetical protein C0610_16650 [Desulfobacteraceae bacterium]|nr:MAG: hypothetical protein C0610_16650 [Desulfobacteraceae bacterium]